MCVCVLKDHARTLAIRGKRLCARARLHVRFLHPHKRSKNNNDNATLHITARAAMRQRGHKNEFSRLLVSPLRRAEMTSTNELNAGHNKIHGDATRSDHSAMAQWNVDSAT